MNNRRFCVVMLLLGCIFFSAACSTTYYTVWEQLGKEKRHLLKDTKIRYARLNAAMTKAQQSMEPVLTNLRDYVLFLKHNLNAQAIGALRAEVSDIEMDVNTLIADMNESIREADEFLETLQ